jgi:hypothetical protein
MTWSNLLTNLKKVSTHQVLLILLENHILIAKKKRLLTETDEKA